MLIAARRLNHDPGGHWRNDGPSGRRPDFTEPSQTPDYIGRSRSWHSAVTRLSTLRSSMKPHYDTPLPPLPTTSKKWHDMTAFGRLVFVGKVAIAFCTFGFVYPHILSD
jgi:hypothetical protein